MVGMLSRTNMKVFLFLTLMALLRPLQSGLSQDLVPDIKVNGLDGPIVVSPMDTLDVSVALSNDGRTDEADWWVAAAGPYGIFFLSLDGWVPNIVPAYMGPLFPLPQIPLLSFQASEFPLGTYFLYFGVDTPMDAEISWGDLYADYVEVGLADDAQQRGNGIARILGPLFMYYLERYFSQIRGDSEIETGLASMLDASPLGREFLARLLNTYKGLPHETKIHLFDEVIVELAGSIQEEIDLDWLRVYIKEAAPHEASIFFQDQWKEPPAAPTDLTAQNFSSTAEPEFPSYAIKLNWQDHSDENGFAILRAFKGAGGEVSPDDFMQISKVSANVTEFVDQLGAPGNADDKYCYRVVAYKVSPIAAVGQPPQEINSYPSNTACASYAPNTSPGPDFDFDGVPDADDYCPGVPGDILGCPDSDKDGVADMAGDKNQDGTPDLIVDNCIGVPGQSLGSYDQGPQPLPGCPLKYKLLWRKMTILNNSLSDFYGEGDDPFLPKDQYGNVITYGEEEPYLVFSFVNGQDIMGDLHSWTTKWCCGERVDVDSHGPEDEPDSDVSGEDSTDSVYLGSLLNSTFNGLPVVGEGGDFATIDGKTGLAMSVTLMERDWTNQQCFSDYVSEFEIAAKTGGFVAKVVGGCAAGSIFGCGAALAQGMVSFILDMFELADDPICANVPDPDDFMGVNGWSISRDDAKFKTSSNGAYALWFDMPTLVKYKILPYIPNPVKVVATMRARLYFCLLREGIPESDIQKVCSSYTQASWPSVQ